ncbi:rhodanese-like domain-containing protein [Lutibacter sp. B1]|uniref:rhodanese-like domain-containing protein n=1 Tax=Lutibacter sp. B1 TaxID=2725996 RepID=UPI0014571EE7|nr:rhodanese-like domain-containing protein [Lutibacter sp. B1]NLP57459.1 rhodanese-like domain-containing protein [Lutibacter sp. B1]
MKIKIKLSFLLFISVLAVSCNNAQQSKLIEEGVVKIVTPVEFKEKSTNQLIVDIRTPREFVQGHIEGAININYFDKNFSEQFSKFDTSKPVFIYCKSGNRTSSASTKISNLGFTQIYDLQGGVNNWIKNRNQIIK